MSTTRPTNFTIKRLSFEIAIVGLRSLVGFRRAEGVTILGIPFENDPFNQIKHYFAEMIVTYHE